MNTFAEIYYPELVADVQEIYWSTIVDNLNPTLSAKQVELAFLQAMSSN